MTKLEPSAAFFTDALRAAVVGGWLMLAACTTPAVREQLQTPEADSVAAAEPAAAAAAKPSKPRRPAAPNLAAVMPASVEAVVELPFWQSIAARYQFVDCTDPSPAVRRWQRIFVQSPTRFGQSLSQVAPWLGYVADELERRKLPAEFVWLPYVESRYHAFRTHGDRPAGVWQLMPATARWRGLRIDANYDGRLDFVAATRAALDLLEHLALAFDRNWPLVTMAYNAGEYRIRGALQRAKSGGASTPERLAVSAITHEHLVKLRALACIVATPGKFALELPDVDGSQQFASMRIPVPFPTTQLATLSGVTVAQWSLWNPAWRHGQVEAGAEILMPRHVLDARGAGIAAAAPETLSPLAIVAAGPGRVHVVRGGESAWTIARLHRVALSALLSANGLTSTSILRPGQKLLVP